MIEKGNKIKITITVGLFIILLISAYFRFVKKGITKPRESDVAMTTAPPDYAAQLKVRLPKPTNRSESVLDEALGSFLRDIFSPLESVKSISSVAPPIEPAEPISRPVPVLELKGTILGGEGPVAIINDQLVREGDWIGEYKVAEIKKKDVLLDSGRVKIELRMVNDE